MSCHMQSSAEQAPSELHEMWYVYLVRTCAVFCPTSGGGGVDVNVI